MGREKPRSQSHAQLFVTYSTASDEKLGVGLGTRLGGERRESSGGGSEECMDEAPTE